MKITPAWRVYILGATLCVALTICSRNFDDKGGPCFMASLTLAGIVYLLAVRELSLRQDLPDASSSLGSSWRLCGTLNFFGRLPAPMMIFIDMFGMDACRGSATTPVLRLQRSCR